MENKKDNRFERIILSVILVITVLALGFLFISMKKTEDRLNKAGDFQLCRDKGGIPIPNWSGLDLSRCDFLPHYYGE